MFLNLGKLCLTDNRTNRSNRTLNFISKGVEYVSLIVFLSCKEQ